MRNLRVGRLVGFNGRPNRTYLTETIELDYIRHNGRTADDQQHGEA